MKYYTQIDFIIEKLKIARKEMKETENELTEKAFWCAYNNSENKVTFYSSIIQVRDKEQELIAEVTSNYEVRTRRKWFKKEKYEHIYYSGIVQIDDKVYKLIEEKWAQESAEEEKRRLGILNKAVNCA